MSAVQTVSRTAVSVMLLAVSGVGSVALASSAARASLAVPAGPAAPEATNAAHIFQPGAPGQPSKPITAAQSLEAGRSAVNPADVKFMQDMIEHHAQAVEMVELLQTRTNRPSMRLLGKRIAMSQSSEIEMMRSWLTRRGETAPDPNAHDMRGMTMVGMLSPQQMTALAAAKGARFDRLYLQGMIQHHRGALNMVISLTSAPDAGEDAALSDFLTNIVADQTAEIERMNELLSRYSHEKH
jgi:uncharacterized protein (DUF305 family)